MNTNEILNVNCIGKCPKCGNELLNYGSLEISDGDFVFYPFECPECGFEGRENYELNYIDTTNNI